VATIQQTIVSKFLEQLAKSEHFDPKRIDRLRKLLSDDKPVKAEQLVDLFTQPQGGDLE
jgi:hypothetical protein